MRDFLYTHWEAHFGWAMIEHLPEGGHLKGYEK
jgi:hypothetical protein